ncbi:DNA methyltransferase [Natronoglomus mannanivorans]|uniref:Type II methyltransferase n=1 Tax=Natronoglomus mannanivorans TaxID=2979990 RepID=A0AAP2Z006_9EURY|nr:site-specific DNA-methyltransferase [Halobacteria archaeon AArc-xg1-1]
MRTRTRTVLSVPIEREGTLPLAFPDDLRFPEALVREFIERDTDAGDTVFDPFAGFGTVLRVAADLDRRAYGLEYDAEKVTYARERLEAATEGGSDSNLNSDSSSETEAPESPISTLHHGDALELSSYDLPEFDYCFTSPPFATDGTTVDPLRDYAGESDYETYLEDLQDVFAQVNRRMRPGGRVVLEVSNLKHDGEVTTLAWDVADSVGEELEFQGEVIVAWEGDETDGYGEEDDGIYGYGYDHSYCLVFEAEGTESGS